ncbi:MAG: hypothetical protein ACI8SE_002116 [Bacteroidia bacterium]|jgi:hypothetical protein
MNRLSVILLGVSLLTASACKNRNQVPEIASVVFSRTVCYGTCPVYTMTITGNGLATFEGERFTDKIGSFTKQFSEVEAKTLFEDLATYSWAAFKDEYPASVSDLPSTVFQFTYKDTNKKVIVSGEHPSALDVLEHRLSKIAESDGWTASNSK